MKAPPADTETCYTFNVFPDAPFTPGLDAKDLIDYRDKHVPFVESSCGFIACPGWPMTKEENTANTTACCEKIGDAMTQSHNAGRCRADDLCLGKCNEDEHSNIPGGHGGCTFAPFDPSKAKMIGRGGTATDCTNLRGSDAAANTSQHSVVGPFSAIVDPCRGSQTVPPQAQLTLQS